MNRDEIKSRDEYDTSIGEKLSPAASAEYFDSDPEIVIPTLYRYEDDEEHQTCMPEVDDITPEAMENYIGAEIILLHGDIVAQGSFRHRKRGVEVNTIGRSNSNPILDTRSYEVEIEYVSISTYSEMPLHKLCMLSLMRRDINTSFLGQSWITRHMDMPYW